MTWINISYSLNFKVTTLSFLFVLLVLIISFATNIYSFNYFKFEERKFYHMSIEQIAIAITRLLSSAKKDKGELGKFYREFMDATIKWIRPIFLIDDGREKPEFTEFVNGGNEDFKKVVLSNVEYLLSTDEQAKNTFLDLLYPSRSGLG